MKKALGVLLTPLLAMFGILLMSPSAQAAFDPKSIMQSTVWVDSYWQGEVEVQFDDNTTKSYLAETTTYCTGFIVSEVGHIATAGHCVLYDFSVRKGLLIDVIKKNNLAPEGSQFTESDLQQIDWKVRADDTPTISIAQPSAVKDAPFDNDGIIAQLLDAQEPDSGDNALLQVAGKDTSGTALLIAQGAPEIRDEVTSVGFPGDLAGISVADRQSPTFKEGTVSAETVSKKGVPQLQIDGELIGGMSGGPTLNGAGEVVGINSSSFTNRNQSYISDTATLRTFLEQNGVKLNGSSNASATSEPQAAAPQSPTNQPAQQSDSTPWVAYVLVGLLILGLVGVILYLLKQKPAPVAAAATPSTSPTNDPPKAE